MSDLNVTSPPLRPLLLRLASPGLLLFVLAWLSVMALVLAPKGLFLADPDLPAALAESGTAPDLPP